MNKARPEIYRKTFASRYELSREHQILEYLGQRHAPVPPVVLSHVEMAYLEMHHGGTDLHQWLNSGSVTPNGVMQAQAFVAVAPTVARPSVFLHDDGRHPQALQPRP